jgi:hypothetical protein
MDDPCRVVAIATIVVDIATTQFYVGRAHNSLPSIAFVLCGSGVSPRSATADKPVGAGRPSHKPVSAQFLSD